MKTLEIARELLDALDGGGTIPSVVERHPGFDWDDGYKVAADLLKLRQQRGERPVGRKIGFTNQNIWPDRNTHRGAADSARRDLGIGVQRAPRDRTSAYVYGLTRNAN